MVGNENLNNEALERGIEDLLAGKKSEIEKSLAEVIDQEKEKARQRIADLEREIQKEKEAIGRHLAMLEEVRSAADDVRGRIAKHVEQAGHCRIMVQRLADKIGEECRNAGELGQEIAALLRKADEETSRVRSELEGRYGLSIPFAEMADHGGVGAALEEALDKLSRYRQGLIALEGDPVPAEESQASPDAPAAAPAPAPGNGGNGGNGLDPEAVSRILDARMKTETVPDGGEFRVYRHDEHTVLDPGSILDAMVRFIEEARALHVRLDEAKSSKDQYFIKRDILSRQESLRKTVLKAVDLCKEETCDLPFPTDDILSVKTLMDIQDRLKMGNWSDPNDLASFEAHVETLRTALSPRMADLATYGKAILDQLR